VPVLKREDILAKKTIKAYLDRIEGNIAVLYLDEDDLFKFDLPLKFLPADIKEGTALKLTIDIDKKKDEKTGKEVEDLRKSLIERS
jgi:hypothetical protein